METKTDHLRLPNKLDCLHCFHQVAPAITAELFENLPLIVEREKDILMLLLESHRHLLEKDVTRLTFDEKVIRHVDVLCCLLCDFPAPDRILLVVAK